MICGFNIKKFLVSSKFWSNPNCFKIGLFFKTKLVKFSEESFSLFESLIIAFENPGRQIVSIYHETFLNKKILKNIYW